MTSHYLKTLFLLCNLAVGTLFASGCQENDSDATLDIDSLASTVNDTLRTKRPEGPTELPTFNTEAPSLFIDLPEQFSVHADSGLGHDEIVIQASSDQDTGRKAIPVVIGRILVGDTNVNLIPPGRSNGTVAGRIGTVPIVWSRWTESLDSGRFFFSHVGDAGHFFRRFDPSAPYANLQLHIYVGGTDSVRINSLISALMTLRLRP